MHGDALGRRARQRLGGGATRNTVHARAGKAQEIRARCGDEGNGHQNQGAGGRAQEDGREGRSGSKEALHGAQQRGAGWIGAEGGGAGEAGRHLLVVVVAFHCSQHCVLPGFLFVFWSCICTRWEPNKPSSLRGSIYVVGVGGAASPGGSKSSAIQHLQIATVGSGAPLCRFVNIVVNVSCRFIADQTCCCALPQLLNAFNVRFVSIIAPCLELRL